LLICEAKQGGSKGEGPLGRRAKAREGEAGSEANVGRGKAKLSPSKGTLWTKETWFGANWPEPYLIVVDETAGDFSPPISSLKVIDAPQEMWDSWKRKKSVIREFFC
jgi:hypothetical protein